MLMEGVRSSQIDNILITQKAVYVIEAKNYRGFIYGSVFQELWTLTQRKRKTYRTKNGKKFSKTHINKYSFYNPVRQNETHVRFIEKTLLHHQPIINVIVFSNRSLLKKIEGTSDAFIINFRDLIPTIHSLESQNSSILSHTQLLQNVAELKNRNVQDKHLRKIHVKKIKSYTQKYKG
jgi:hypothetical protein